MKDNELKWLESLSLLKTTTKLFLTAFEEQGYPKDAVNALYIIYKQVRKLDKCSEKISKDLMEADV